MCPRRLFSTPIGSWLSCPQHQEAATLSLFQLPWVYKQAHSGQNHQSHLCCCLDNTSPRPAFTSTSAAASGCFISRPQELVPVSPCSCPPRGPQPFHRKSTHSQERARKCAIDFFIACQLTLKNVLANALLPFHHKSTHSQERACKCTVDFHSQVTSLLTSSHSGRVATVAWFSLRGAVILLLQAWYCLQVPRILLDRTPTVGWVVLSSFLQYLLRYCLVVPHVLLDRTH